MVTNDGCPKRICRKKMEATGRRQLALAGYQSLKALDCLYRDGTMTLRGQVPTYFHKQIAQESFRDLDHVTQINNEIEVESNEHSSTLQSFFS
jgi:osmotically-inducible protein OsmY